MATRTKAQSEALARTFAEVGYVVRKGLCRLGSRWMPGQALILEDGSAWFFTGLLDDAQALARLAQTTTVAQASRRGKLADWFRPI